MTNANPQKYTYGHAVVGGTFDHFHKGHERLLLEAFAKAAHVTIGVTEKDLSKEKVFSCAIESYAERTLVLRRFLHVQGILPRATLIPISDMYGNTLSEEKIDAILATDETIANVNAINDKRKLLGLPKLAIIQTPLLESIDRKVISSTRIRKGEIDRNGNEYFDLFAKKKQLLLPEELKPLLRRPFGKVTKSLRHVDTLLNSNSLIITVGDVVTLNLSMKNIRPDIAVFDFLTRRHKIHEEYKNILEGFMNASITLRTDNPPGTIQRRAVGAFRKALNNFFETGEKQIISVKGEEDLLTIPAILLAPLGSIVAYGQMGKGTVLVKVTEKKKAEMKKILEKFA